ncbi:MAG: peptidylprolyl isomerase [Pirellulaceae bacterium]|jgi:cyclophilin family peptidyl-prolyl cis-trans isomerase|nr:peptidylprolyl isomerase [Pirellulaceae bacterium]
MVYRCVSAGLAVLLSVAALTSIGAQDDVAAKDDAAARAEKAIRPFAEVSAEWDSTYKSISELEDKYRTAPAAEKGELVKQHDVLMKKSLALLPELRSAALAAYEAAPNADEKVTSTLVGLLANDVRSDRYSKALKLGNLLLKHKCEEPAVEDLVGSAAYCTDDFKTAAVHLKKAKAANALSRLAHSYLSDLDQATKSWAREQALRQAEAAADNLPRVKMQTNKGDLVIELLENEAPQTVANFISLVDKEYYNDLTFHRVLSGFMAQAGCPDGTGTGGPGYNIYCECHQENHRHHFRGTLSMAHTGKENTGGSQFFLTFRRTAHLDGLHTVFGRVIEGMDVLAKLQRRDPSGRGQPDPDKIVKAEVLRKRDHQYVPTKVGE